MAYDENLAARIRDELGGEPDVMEKKMFGGLAFLVHGNMSVSASGKGGIMLRCRPDRTDEFVARGAERMVMRGKEMDGWIRVSDDLVADDDVLASWVGIGLEYARSLPAK
jgi:TfoX/Sxy family transcriptional regulator of competence genes